MFECKGETFEDPDYQSVKEGAVTYRVKKEEVEQQDDTEKFVQK